MEGYDGPVLDDHLHLDPEGEGGRALKEFARAGGTHALVVHKPYRRHRITSGADFGPSFELTADLARKAAEDSGVRTFVAVGPYPVEYIHLSESMGPSEAEDAMLEGMEAAARLVEEGKARAIGEIGRPHFDVEPDVMEASNRILLEGMRMAVRADCPVILHTESATPDVYADLASMADRARLPRGRVVKHFSPPLVDTALNAGLFPSVLASGHSVVEAARQGTRFMMETDYLDDPRRPGAVMGPRTVPKRTAMLLRDGHLTPGQMWVVHRDNPERVYGVDMDL